MTVQVFIDGAAGTTGLEIASRLGQRDDLALITLDEQRRKDDTARAEALNDCDIAVLCLPDDAARAAVAMIRNDRTRVIDASTAHRVAPDWTYGFPELCGRQAVATARFLSNPGCYPTGFLALVAPLVRDGVLPEDWPITCHAVSGYSGGGKAMIAQYEETAAPPVFRAYALSGGHKHLDEMRVHGGLVHAPVFAPAVVSGFRGMIVEVPLALAAMQGREHGSDGPAVDPAQIRASLQAAYEGSRIVRVAPDGAAPAALTIAADTPPFDDMVLHVLPSPDHAQVRLVAVLDNLGKGASGAAVQNLNLMAGLCETAGLRLAG
ncbi:N-acetyl-gamma-glutamyl-phosphate reductase [Croceicoccus sp. F390]|uniref:N-acetyl-gamma-glutamyl-phosphate reductase n=1 Tax=Croceicoccus esteveae TaxID=3075597 RepID=A0ABU2ZI15_9SPHN|nr:N-acetyl-gamma-glutamyl-phosphate reductase [Croceicoccus sp. F390]MDT0575673.1 N-acetyl-gamma-glutamyl-phosphate reductase [Croceicoccus sp. F390]